MSRVARLKALQQEQQAQQAQAQAQQEQQEQQAQQQQQQDTVDFTPPPAAADGPQDAGALREQPQAAGLSRVQRMKLMQAESAGSADTAQESKKSSAGKLLEPAAQVPVPGSEAPAPDDEGGVGAGVSAEAPRKPFQFKLKKTQYTGESVALQDFQSSTDASARADDSTPEEPQPHVKQLKKQASSRRPGKRDPHQPPGPTSESTEAARTQRPDLHEGGPSALSMNPSSSVSVSKSLSSLGNGGVPVHHPASTCTRQAAVASRLIDDLILSKRQVDEAERLKKVKSTVSRLFKQAPEAPLGWRMGKIHRECERRLDIIKGNDLMIRKITEVTSEYPSATTARPAVGGSLNAEQRKRHLKEIQDRNLQIHSRLAHMQPMIRRDDLLKSYEAATRARGLRTLFPRTSAVASAPVALAPAPRPAPEAHEDREKSAPPRADSQGASASTSVAAGGTLGGGGRGGASSGGGAAGQAASARMRQLVAPDTAGGEPVASVAPSHKPSGDMYVAGGISAGSGASVAAAALPTWTGPARGSRDNASHARVRAEIPAEDVGLSELSSEGEGAAWLGVQRPAHEAERRQEKSETEASTRVLASEAVRPPDLLVRGT